MPGEWNGLVSLLEEGGGIWPIRDMATGSRIEIRGFGSFCLNYRPERLGRNPKSGESVVVPAKYVPHFKAGKEMRLRVDGSAQEA